MKICKCGCGGEVKETCTWLRGHSRRGVKLTPEQRKAISESQKKNSYFHKYNKTEEHRQKVIKSNAERIVSEETKQKIAASLVGFKHTEETKLKMHITHIDTHPRGEKNPCWKGGVGKYAAHFSRLSAEIKKRDSNKCTKCGSTRNLHAHHLDFDKKNDSPLNLTTLCKSCHSKLHPKGFILNQMIRKTIVKRKRTTPFPEFTRQGCGDAQGNQ